MRRGLALAAVLAAAAGALPVLAAPRDPFVPVNYRPPEPVRFVEPAVTNLPPPQKTGVEIANMRKEQMEILRRHINVKGVFSSGGAYMAVVNDSVLRVGDTVAIAAGGQTFKLRVSAIEKSTVNLEWMENPGNPDKDAVTQGARDETK
jgi:hypothetical protein